MRWRRAARSPTLSPPDSPFSSSAPLPSSPPSPSRSLSLSFWVMTTGFRFCSLAKSASGEENNPPTSTLAEVTTATPAWIAFFL